MRGRRPHPGRLDEFRNTRIASRLTPAVGGPEPVPKAGALHASVSSSCATKPRFLTASVAPTEESNEPSPRCFGHTDALGRGVPRLDARHAGLLQ